MRYLATEMAKELLALEKTLLPGDHLGRSLIDDALEWISRVLEGDDPQDWEEWFENYSHPINEEILEILHRYQGTLRTDLAVVIYDNKVLATFPNVSQAYEFVKTWVERYTGEELDAIFEHQLLINGKQLTIDTTVLE